MTPTPPPTDESKTSEGPTYVVHPPEGGISRGEEVGSYTEIKDGDTLVTGVKVDVEDGRGPVI